MARLGAFLAFVFFCSCSSRKDPGDAEALKKEIEVRQEWEKSAKRVAVIMPQDLPLDVVGVCIEADNSMTDEKIALTGAEFRPSMEPSDSGFWVCLNEVAVTNDSLARISACWPVRPGLKPGQSIRVEAPFSDYLCLSETRRTVGVEGFAFISELQARRPMATLQIEMTAEDSYSTMEGLQISGSDLAVGGEFYPYEGGWDSLRFGGTIVHPRGCIGLASGRMFNFFLPPSSEAQVVKVQAKIKGRYMSREAVLPPMQAGSLVRLHLYAYEDELKLRASWVGATGPWQPTETESERPRVGGGLAKDGTFRMECDSLCIAAIVEVDSTGWHGRAVALESLYGEAMFSSDNATSGVLYSTLDGRGGIARLNAKADNLGPGERTTAWFPEAVFADSTAFGGMKGCELTAKLMKNEPIARNIDSEPTLMQALSEAGQGAYCPSAAEMAWLFWMEKPLRGASPLPNCYQKCYGLHMTSSECTETTFWAIDMESGAISGQWPKAYARSKIRWWYRF